MGQITRGVLVIVKNSIKFQDLSATSIDTSFPKIALHIVRF